MTEPQTIPADMVRQLIQPHLDSDVSTPALWDLVKSLESLLPSPPTPLAEIKFGGKAMWGEKEVLIVAESPNNGGRLPIYWREEDKMTGSDQAWVNPSELLQHPDDAATVDRTGWEGKNGPFPDPVGPYADRFSPDIQEVVESWLQERDFGVTNLVKTTLEAISEAAALLNDEQGTGSQQEPKMGEAWLTEVSAGETIVALCGRVDPKDTELTWFTDDGAGWDMDYLTPLARLVPETDREMLAVEEELQLLRAENARLTRAVNFCEWNWSEAEVLIKENERMHREGKHD